MTEQIITVTYIFICAMLYKVFYNAKKLIINIGLHLKLCFNYTIYQIMTILLMMLLIL